MARKWFYVCAGIFLLAGAYGLGARSVGAQAPANPLMAVEETGLAYAANGDVYLRTGSGLVWTYTYQGNVGNGAANPIVATESGAVYTSNGDVYQRTNGNPFEYTYRGNVFSSTPVSRQTMGHIKARYR